MSNINKCFLSGNLTREPEVRTSQSGMAVLKLGMAVNDRVKENGEWTDRANFIDLVMFGKRAEFVGERVHKGTKVYVEGKLRQSTWEKDGQRRSKLEVVVDEIEFQSYPSAQTGSYDYDDEPFYSDDIPFN